MLMVATRLLAACCLLLGAVPCASLTVAPSVRMIRAAQPRAPSPRAALDVSAAGATLSLPQLLPTPSLLLAEGDFFGEVFLAGMSIALAAVAATVFVGFVVRGRYDAIEESFFESQDDSQAKKAAADLKSTNDASAADFFGDIDPQSKQ